MKLYSMCLKIKFYLYLNDINITITKYQHFKIYRFY